MDNKLPFRITSIILFLVTWGIRKYYERQAVEVARKGLLHDRDNKAMIGLQRVLLMVSLSALLVHLLYPRGVAWSIIELPGWAQWAGAVLGIGGEVLLVRSHYVLGENFFGGVKIREGHELVEEGPYRWVRHPIYTAFIALGIGLFLLTESWMVGVPWLMSIGLALVTRVGEEEAMMIEQFGDAYERYKARTGRFLPRLSRSRAK